MKAHIKIPRGWRRLRIIFASKGDRWLDADRMEWRRCLPAPCHFGDFIVIRKIKARKGGKGK